MSKTGMYVPYHDFRHRHHEPQGGQVVSFTLRPERSTAVSTNPPGMTQAGEGVTRDTGGNTDPERTLRIVSLMDDIGVTSRPQDVQVTILMSHGWQLKSLCSHCIDLARGKNKKGEDFYKDLLYTAFCILMDIAHSFGWSLMEILDCDYPEAISTDRKE